MIINVYGTRRDTLAEEYLYTTSKHKTLESAQRAFYSANEIAVSSVPGRTIYPDDYCGVDFYRADTV